MNQRRYLLILVSMKEGTSINKMNPAHTNDNSTTLSNAYLRYNSEKISGLNAVSFSCRIPDTINKIHSSKLLCLLQIKERKKVPSKSSKRNCFVQKSFPFQTSFYLSFSDCDSQIQVPLFANKSIQWIYIFHTWILLLSKAKGSKC